MKIRVSLIEDDARLRVSWEAILKSLPELTCAGVHPSAEDAIEHLPAAAPHVALVDIELPGLSGVDCVRRLKLLCPNTVFLMLTVHEDNHLIFESLQAGASGYLLKRTPLPRLIEAIADAHAGGSPMSSAVARRVVRYFHELPPVPKELADLTAREYEVLGHLEKGLTYDEISSTLAISVHTVRAHLRSVYEKLHVRGRTQAVAVYHKKLR